MNLPSRLIEEAVDQMATLPGIGRKTALRLVLNMLKRSPEEVERFAGSFVKMKASIKECATCHNLSDNEVCSVCSDPRRDHSLICVVENIRDLMAIEFTEQFRGVYHVLGGIISPMDGVGPADLNIESLIERAHQDQVNEVVFALSTTMEGETTCFYLYKKLAPSGVQVSSIARGVAIGDELQYTDEVTLGRSIMQRQPYENSINRS